ncbi:MULTISPECIES: hypothetical protein [Prevotellaceae]|jgi:hypothetical protein|uniref:hypothetical protein n=1 Tax=Prevotellaceae TaxID=171552 RepID=UPI0003648969|nr:MULTISPECIES: hypothetical protein [Prevotellaceae]MBF1388692.1 hypothetical protein [Prevotella denticola]
MNSLLLNATSLLLQASVKGKVNEVLSNYAVPVIAGIIVISVAIAIFTNLDGIVDRDGTGTRKGAIMNVVWVVLYVIIGIAVLAGIVRLVGSMSLSI